MTDSFPMPENWNAAVSCHKFDKFTGAPWNNQVHVAFQSQKLHHVCPRVKKLQDIHLRGRKASQAPAPQFNERFVGVLRLCAAFQNQGVS